MSSLASPAGAAIPSFATVTLVFAGDDTLLKAAAISVDVSSAVESKTMRVPVTAHTTIRELAKGAMTRYMLSLRRTAKGTDFVARQLCRTGIVVTDVHLLSSHKRNNTPVVGVVDAAPRQSPSRIELFAEDCVVQVVQVREEVVYMRFQSAAEHSIAKKALPLRAAAATETAVQKTAEKEGDKNGVGEDSASVATPFSPSHSAVAPLVANAGKWSVMPAEHHGVTTGSATDDEVVSVCGAAEELSEGDISVSEPLPRITATAPATASHALMGSKTATAKAKEAGRLASVRPDLSRHVLLSSLPEEEREEHDGDKREESSSDTGSSSSDRGSDDAEELQNIARSIATLRQDETRRMPWGPDAYKHFASNYVNSPQKIMTGRYNYKRRRQQQQPPPSVKLHHAQSSPSVANAAAGKGASLKSLAKDRRAEENAQKMDEKDTDAGPYKMCRVEEISSCDHSQVSVTLSCGINSHSITPNTCTASETSSRFFPPGPATASGTATIAGAPALAAVENAAATAEVSCSDPNIAVEKATGEGGPTHNIAKSPDEAAPAISTTPVDGVYDSATSPPVPMTVAKPMQGGLVARQLSFEESDDGGVSKPATQANLVLEADTPAVQVLTVRRVFSPGV